jgi:hypothetical protein
VSAPARRARDALTAHLRSVRRAANLTGTPWRTSSGRAGASPKISKIESGRQMLTEDEIRAWAKVTGSDVDALLALHHRAQHEFETFRDAYPAEGGSAAHQATYAAAEQAATTLCRSSCTPCYRHRNTLASSSTCRAVPSTTAQPRTKLTA